MTERSARLFIALPLPSGLKDRLVPALAAIAAEAPRARLSAPADLHLTLRFLGETSQARLPVIGEALEAMAARTARFSVSLAGARTFGAPHHPRVLWADVSSGGRELAALAREVATTLGRPTDEDEPFTPHVTLARARLPRGDGALAAACRALASLDVGSFVVGSLVLYESRTLPSGARYQIVREAALPA